MLVVDIIILCGLPGSGKTRYTKRLGKGAKVIHFDNNPEPYKDLDFPRDSCSIVFDGLFLRNQDVINVISDFDKNNPGIWTIGRLEIHWWKENREVCLRNDSLRPPERSAAVTIKTAPYEYPDEEIIRKGVSLDIGEFLVIEEEVHDVISDFNKEPEIIESDPWCLGGTWRDWMGNSGTVSSEPQPTEFKKLENILDHVEPELTRRDYKMILGKVEVIEYKEKDYYGGSVMYANYRILKDDLMKTLINLGYEYVPEENGTI